ncbi:MAG: heme biosynthesis HemY N-terminal domain-containing protein [Cohaesibacteraceae bacterium]
MLRVLIFLGLVLAFGLGFAWLADRPGTVAIDWMGYQVELSAMLAAIGLAIVIVGVMATWWVLKTILRSPQIMGGYFSARRRDRGYDALSSGLVAAGSGDGKAAQRHAKMATKLMPEAPLTRVLAASSADLAGDPDGKRLAYRQMLDDPKTQLLGLRGLYLDAVQQDDEEAARHYAGQAAALAPALPWAGEAQFEDQVQRGDWPAARAALERNLQARIVTKAERYRLRAVLLTADALDREAGDPEAARPLVVEAARLAPDLVPASAVAGRLLIRQGKMTQASKVIESCWKKAPHPELAEVYLYVRPGDAVADRVKRARKLVQLCAHELEGELALARTQMEAGDLDDARQTLSAFTGSEATQRVCLLMAEIEEQDGGDTVAMRGWLARALRARRDPAWVADGYISASWEPVSPLSGKVDAFEWKVPVERFTGHEPVDMPENAIADDGQVMLPARLPTIVAAGGMAAGEVEAEAGEDASMVADKADAAIVVDAVAPSDEEPTGEPEPRAAGDAAASEASVETTSDEGPAAKATPEPSRADADGVGADGANDGDEVSAAQTDAETGSDADLSTDSEVVKPVVVAGSGEVVDTTLEVANDDEPSDPPAVESASSDAKAEEPNDGATVTVVDATDAENPHQEEEPYRGLPGGHAPDDPGHLDEEELAAEEGRPAPDAPDADGNPRRRFRLF